MTILECKNIKKVYKTKKIITEALNGVDFSVEKGEFISIMGESGAGKTTLLNIIATLDRATSGTLKLNGKDVGTLKNSEISAFRRKELGFVFQDFNLLDQFNNKENILKIINDKKLDQTLRKFASEVATNWNYAVDSAGWYWDDGQGKSGVIAIVKGSINPIADTDNVRNVTAKINAGLSHLNERENYTELFKKAMNYDKKKCDKNKKK